MFQMQASRTPKNGTETGGVGPVEIERRPGRLRRARLTFAVSIALAAMLMAAVPMPAAAQSLNGGGKIRAEASCSMSTHLADVTVKVEMPDGYPNGLYFYTQIWAKARGASTYTFIKDAYSDRLWTWSTKSTDYGTYLVQNHYVLATGRFTGRGYQDIHIMWKSKVPGGNWGGWNWFNVPGDSHSTVVQLGAYGDGANVSSCSL